MESSGMMGNIFMNINAEVIITTHNLNNQFIYLGNFKKALTHISNKYFVSFTACFSVFDSL